MRKKLVIFMPSIEGGGVEKNLFIISNYLATKLDKISIISASLKYKSKFKKNINFIAPKSKIWDLKSRRTKYFVCLFLLLKQIIKNNNILVFAFQANIYCIIICKLLGIKIITRSNSAPSGWSKNFFKRIVFKFFLNRADKVMANSNDFIKSLKSEFNVKSLCIYNPLNKQEIIKKSKIKSKKIFKESNKLKILNIGRFVDQKDQITFLKALNLIKDKIEYEAILVGKGKDKAMLKNYINKNKLDKKIKLVNFVENPYPFIRETEILILSSKYEGLPNVLLEAQVLKKFIISSNCPTGPREILLNGKGGLLFKVGDFKELANKILYYKKNKKKLSKLVNFGYKKLYRFDYDLNLKKYLELVQKF
jgi:glycosyltransferase involved in cell wall biosynthesis